MAFLKKLLIGVGVLVVVAGAAAAGAYFLLSDDETAGFKYSGEELNLENEIGSDLATSLKTIKDSDYADNKITVDLTIDQLNSYVVTTIKNSMNIDYPTTQNYIYAAGGFQVDSVYFKSAGSNLEFYACLSYGGWFKTAAKLSAGISIVEGNILNIALTNISVGKYIKFETSGIQSLLSNFKQYLSSVNVEGLDLEKMTYSIDLNKVVNEALADNAFMRDLVSSFAYTASIADDKITLNLDTTDIFTGHRTPKTISGESLDTLYSSFATDIMTSENKEATITVTEAQLNYLAKDSLDDALDQFDASFDFGNQKFTMTVSDPYYTISTALVETGIALNGTESTCSFFSDITPMKSEDGTEVTKLSINATLASLGNLTFGESADFSYDFSIEASSLLSSVPEIVRNNVKIKDFSVNKETSTASITYGLKA